MNKTKIEWCDYTINPIKGLCKNECWYCYARKMYKRFKWNPEMRIDWGNSLRQVGNKKPSKIFIGSTYDIFGSWVETQKIKDIINFTTLFPQHTFQFLTKNPLRYCDFKFPNNCWIGITHTGFTPKGYIYVGTMDSKVLIAFENHKNTFLSCEPLLGGSISIPTNCRWVIVGAMTGQGSQKYQPKIGWIEDILKQTDRLKIPVFMKNNLQWKGKLRQEFPDE